LIFRKVSGSIKSGTFSGGYFSSFSFSKIGSGLCFKKFRVKLNQVSKIDFKVFSLGFGEQAVSFGEVRFSWLALLLAKSGFKNRLQGF
jgi:hypothetical protein